MTREIYLAGGCFWGLQHYLSFLYGVQSAVSGYANGSTENPTYREVCAGSGHAETVKTVYDEELLPLATLLEYFFDVIDPTLLNRQGHDAGINYRTGIYYTDPGDRARILAFIDSIRGRYAQPIVTEVQELAGFWPAEEYHQEYLVKNPGGYCHIDPAAFERAKQTGLYRRQSREALRQQLTPLSFSVTQQADTERPFGNEYCGAFEKGIYVDITSGQPLFVSSDKFESGCGWPAFSRPIDDRLLSSYRDDTIPGRPRVEVRAKNSGAHLGHVFEDGPQDAGGLRYCINSAALRFIPYEEMEREGYAAYMPVCR